MLSDDWTQLERICARLEELHHRRVFAEQRDNVLLLKQIDEEIANTEAQRKRHLGRIRFRLIEDV
jgi:hypothetical protein